MGLTSMTGFARADGSVGGLRWSWELKTVNGKGLDIRLRMPPGFDALEPAARAALGAKLQRGTCHANLSVSREGQAPVIRINDAALEQLVAALDVLKSRIDATAPSLDGLLAVRGVVEIADAEADEATKAAEGAAILAGLAQAADQLSKARRGEGEALQAVIEDRLAGIEQLTKAADQSPARQPDAIREKLAEQIKALIGSAPMLDQDRLHQEAVLLATKADIREELDRLYAHVAAARALLAEGNAVGRRLDFLAQEFGRESNTLCAKSNHVSLTAIGLELKAVIEQFREQVQNVE
ncbi:YicC/YloC family endoribonuclease [Flaviflagellibacter deserti]|uniref:YicC/YloC family endoribonuclease n=1 Tax=Flaviflagellibacter deserti TaxID=2267266 RepID=A0ABV9Z655_9HYPH